MANARYRDNLVGENGSHSGTPVAAARPSQISNAPKWTVTGRWPGPADRRQRHARPALCRYPAHDHLQYRFRSRHREDAGRLLGRECAARLLGPDERWAIEVWAQNMFNKNYHAGGVRSPIQGTRVARACSPGRLLPACDAALRRVPRGAADIRRDAARQARLRSPAPPPYVAPPPPPPPPVVEQPAPPPPPPPPPPAPTERGERG